MPVVIDNKVNELGTLVDIVEISKIYDTWRNGYKNTGAKNIQGFGNNQ